MEEQPPRRRAFPLALAAVAGAVLASVLWALTLQDRNERHEEDFRLYSGRVETLGERLETQNASMRELLNEFGKAQEGRLDLELQLAHSQAQLQQARNELAAFDDGDWAGRLEEEQQRAGALDAELTGMRQTLDDSAAANAELRSQIEGSAALVKKLKGQVDNSAGEIEKLKRQLAYFSSQQQKPVADANQGYRLQRIESLHATMKGRSSAERRSILASVIPAVPGGLSGAELAELMKGMDSADVLELVKAAQPQLQRPVAEEDRKALIALMSEQDAATASPLLAGGEAE